MSYVQVPDPADLRRLAEQLEAEVERSQERIDALNSQIERLSPRQAARRAGTAPRPLVDAVAPRVSVGPPTRPADASRPASTPPAPAPAPSHTVVPTARPATPVIAAKPAVAAPPPAIAERRSPTPVDEPRDPAITDNARLIAIEMAVAGKTRDAVCARLHAFGVDQPELVVSEVFGDAEQLAPRFPRSRRRGKRR